MNIPSVNLNEEVKAGDTPPVVDSTDGVKPFSRAEKNPSSWDIRPADEEDCIVATHTDTRRVYEGTIEGFNELLRG